MPRRKKSTKRSTKKKASKSPSNAKLAKQLELLIERLSSQNNIDQVVDASLPFNRGFIHRTGVGSGKLPTKNDKSLRKMPLLKQLPFSGALNSGEVADVQQALNTFKGWQEETNPVRSKEIQKDLENQINNLKAVAPAQQEKVTFLRKDESGEIVPIDQTQAAPQLILESLSPVAGEDGLQKLVPLEAIESDIDNQVEEVSRFPQYSQKDFVLSPGELDTPPGPLNKTTSIVRSDHGPVYNNNRYTLDKEKYDAEVASDINYKVKHINDLFRDLKNDRKAAKRILSDKTIKELNRDLADLHVEFSHTFGYKLNPLHWGMPKYHNAFSMLQNIEAHLVAAVKRSNYEELAIKPHWLRRIQKKVRNLLS